MLITNLLSVPFVSTWFGARSFSVAAPRIWNSPSISPYLYQSWYLPSSSQDPLLPAGIPIHLTPLLLRLRFGFCWPLCAFINYIYLLPYLLTNETDKRDGQLRLTSDACELWTRPMSRCPPELLDVVSGDWSLCDWTWGECHTSMSPTPTQSVTGFTSAITPVTAREMYSYPTRYIYNFISPTYVVAQHKWKKRKI